MANNLRLLLNDNMVDMAHQLLSQVVTVGDVVLDATCGRGRDSLFLAQTVGSTGKVYAFDIQQEAIDATKALLLEHRAAQPVSLILADHSQLKAFIHQSLRAAVFNLGYLPGGDKRIRTSEETTLKAIMEAMELLSPSGILIVVAYPGHQGGKEERDAVMTLLSSQSGNCWRIGHLELLNKRQAPCLFYAVKIREGAE